MMVNKNFNQDFNQNENIENIDLIKFYNFLFRNKKIIGSFGIVFFLLACIFALTQKRLWQGQFQIVLDKEKSSRLNDILSGFSGFSATLGLQNNFDSDLQTEVGILESPSILMPVFDFVNSEWKIKNPDKKSLNFYRWKENLDIRLKKNTAILNITYADENKNIILPVLSMISDTYQDYSGKNERENLFFTKKYLNEQIRIYKNKSQNSIKLAQEYAVDQNLSFVGIDNNFSNAYTDYSALSNITGKSNSRMMPIRSSVSSGFQSLTNIAIENVRARAANEIKRIDIQIKQISEIDDPQELQYVGSLIPAIVQEGLTEKLKSFEMAIINRKQNYTDKDKVLKNLILQKEITAKLIKERSIGFLKAKRIMEKAKMEAAIRPKGVLIKYRELLREAERQENTLFGLENQLNQINLLSARINKPWELITKPTLLDFPVSMSRKKIGILGLFLGLIFGYVFSIYKEKKANILFDKFDIEDIFDSPILEYNFEDKFKNLYLIETIKNNSLSQINLLTTLLPNKFNIDNLVKNIKMINQDIKILKNNDILTQKVSQLPLLILLKENIKINEAKEVKRILDKAEIKLFGIILYEK